MEQIIGICMLGQFPIVNEEHSTMVANDRNWTFMLNVCSLSVIGVLIYYTGKA